MRKPAFVVVAAVAVTATAAAPTHRVPGEWETTNSMRFSAGGVQIPPAIRQQMQAHGIKLPDFSKPHTFKYCLSPEEAARDQQGFSENKNCKTTNLRWSGEHFHVEFTCTAGGGQTHGVVDGSISADGKAYAGTMRMQGDEPALGGRYAMQGKTSGQWLDPTCSQGAD
jgi:hypothetical protein